MRLIQIPFSHNCLKVRRAIELKGLGHEIENVPPMDRSAVRRASGQSLVPVLLDGDRALADSTEILLYLEASYPQRPLLPAEPELRAECLLLEDWADAAFMALTRRLAYWQTLAAPDALETLFFPDARGVRRRVQGHVARRVVRRRFGLWQDRNRKDEVEARRLAGLAADRLAERDYLVGGRLTLADLTLAAMSAPLAAAAPAVRNDAAVQRLLEWGGTILGPWP